MTPGEVLDASLKLMGRIVVVSGKDFTIKGALTSTDFESVRLSVDKPLRPSDPAGGLGRQYVEFTVPLFVIDSIEDEADTRVGR